MAIFQLSSNIFQTYCHKFNEVVVVAFVCHTCYVLWRHRWSLQRGQQPGVMTHAEVDDVSVLVPRWLSLQAIRANTQIHRVSRGSPMSHCRHKGLIPGIYCANLWPGYPGVREHKQYLIDSITIYLWCIYLSHLQLLSSLLLALWMILTYEKIL